MRDDNFTYITLTKRYLCEADDLSQMTRIYDNCTVKSLAIVEYHGNNPITHSGLWLSTKALTPFQ